jgi:hypothetical protein
MKEQLERTRTFGVQYVDSLLRSHFGAGSSELQMQKIEVITSVAHKDICKDVDTVQARATEVADLPTKVRLRFSYRRACFTCEDRRFK